MKKSTLLVCSVIGIILGTLFAIVSVDGLEISISSWSTDTAHWIMRIIFLSGLGSCLMFPFVMAGMFRNVIRATTGKDLIGPVPVFSH